MITQTVNGKKKNKNGKRNPKQIMPVDDEGKSLVNKHDRDSGGSTHSNSTPNGLNESKQKLLASGDKKKQGSQKQGYTKTINVAPGDNESPGNSDHKYHSGEEDHSGDQVEVIGKSDKKEHKDRDRHPGRERDKDKHRDRDRNTEKDKNRDRDKDREREKRKHQETSQNKKSGKHQSRKRGDRDEESDA